MEKAKVWSERVVIPSYDIGEAERLLSRCEDNYYYRAYYAHALGDDGRVDGLLAAAEAAPTVFALWTLPITGWRR